MVTKFYLQLHFVHELTITMFCSICLVCILCKKNIHFIVKAPASMSAARLFQVGAAHPNPSLE